MVRLHTVPFPENQNLKGVQKTTVMEERNFKNDEMIDMEKEMDRLLKCIYLLAKTEQEKEYFKEEYRKLHLKHMKAAEEWMAVL